MPEPRSRFRSDFQVRPDDIDMNRHVHNSRYFDYVLAARYDQMERCYGMPMEEFIALGYSWVTRTAHVEYRRPLRLGDRFTVITWIDEIARHGVKVRFEIVRAADGGIASRGWFDYIMVAIASGKPERIPGSIVEKYSI
ncbi:MAG: putative thioesterase [Chlorobi bacterium]|nr:putative thioesterase [Chlorobiota bacterium]